MKLTWNPFKDTSLSLEKKKRKNNMTTASKQGIFVLFPYFRDNSPD